MKKLLFTLLVVCLSTGAFAQLNGGIKAGLNFGSQKWELGSDSESYSGTGFHIGGYLTFGLSDALSLQPELLYNAIKVDAGGDDLTLSYLTVPVMFQYGFAENKFNVQAGPSLGLLLSSDPSEFKDNDGVTGTDFSLALGAGANFGKLNVTARYSIGLANIAGDALVDSFGDDFSIKNNNFQLSVGYKLFGE